MSIAGRAGSIRGRSTLILGCCAWITEAQPDRPPLRLLALLLASGLTIEAVAMLGAFAIRPLAIVGEVAFPLAFLLFVGWLYCARVYADGTGWPQRHARAWVVGAWLMPALTLWYPFQFVADVWRASLPASRRSARAVLPRIWWACWLAQFLVFAMSGGHTFGPMPVGARVPPEVKVVMAAWAALTLAVVVQASRRLLAGQAQAESAASQN
jgi:Domain of unknown function (DUF4328)